MNLLIFTACWGISWFSSSIDTLWEVETLSQVVSALLDLTSKNKIYITKWSTRYTQKEPAIVSISKTISFPVHTNNRALQNSVLTKVFKFSLGADFLKLHGFTNSVGCHKLHPTGHWVLLRWIHYSYLILWNGFICNIGLGDWIMLGVRQKSGKWFPLSVFKLYTSLPMVK